MMKGKLLVIGLLCLLLLINHGFCQTGGSSDSSGGGSTRIVYSSAELCSIAANNKSSVQINLDNIPREIRRRKRGRAGGVRKRLHSRKCKPFLPSLIMGNVQSVRNKHDELAANVRFMQDYKNVSIMSFSESWLKETRDLNEHVAINGFKLLRGDRILENTDKVSGGGVCVYINEQWCHPNNAVLKRHSCSSNLEILTVSLRPYYLPREFSHVIHSTIYIPDKKVTKQGEDELFSIIQDIERQSPNALHIIDGDFNHGSLKRCTSRYYQHVNCNTRGDARLDLCYSNVKDAYKCRPLPQLGRSDHDMLLLSPKYRPLVQRQRPQKITIKQWNDDNAVDELQAALESTDWDMFIEANPELNDLTDTIGCYINFCVECIIPQKTVKVFPNNKPWITKAVKDVINKKKQVFGQGDKSKLKVVQKELDRIIKIEKEKYRTKIEQKFTQNNMRQVWEGMRLMSGYSKSGGSKNYLPDTSVRYANNLNDFYNRFDKNDFSNEISTLKTTLEYNLSDNETVFQVSEYDVCHEFLKLNSNKSAGPDNITPRLLKVCAKQLAYIFTVIFNLSFKTHVVPDIWKRSCIVPIPKKPVIACMNDLRPVALTSIPMKVCERLFRKWLSAYTEDCVDPLQFAYCSKRSCSDAILLMLEKLYHHCDHARFGNSVRIMFFDFSSAFNTIQPHLLIKKLLDQDIPKCLLSWILNYLTNRTQYVRLSRNGTISRCLQSNTGAPQGTVLAPFLFTLYTSDCRSTESSCPLIKFADDTAMLGLITNDNDTVFQQQLLKFVNYCDANFLELNVFKTKEMIIDFRASIILKSKEHRMF